MNHTINKALSQCDRLLGVLVDDDPFVRDEWQASAVQHGGYLATYASFAEFRASMLFQHVQRMAMPVFIDHDLGCKETGLDAARQLRQSGFARVYLATGYLPDDFRGEVSLAGVVGKAPPAWLFPQVISSTRVADVDDLGLDVNSDATLLSGLSRSERRDCLQKLSPARRVVFEERLQALQAANAGDSSGLFPLADGSGAFWPEIVLLAWERAIFQDVDDVELQRRLDLAWRASR